jgi:hypothetical protein
VEDANSACAVLTGALGSAVRLSFLARCLPPAAQPVDFGAADEATRTALARILCVAVPEASFLQASLPVAMGGMGLREVAAYREAMFADSWERNGEWVLATLAVVAGAVGKEPPKLDGMPARRPPASSTAEAGAEAGGTGPPPGGVPARQPPASLTHVAQLDERRRAAWYETLTEAGRVHADDLACPEAGVWLRSPPVDAFYLHIDAPEFRRSLAHRLLAPAVPEAAGREAEQCPRCHRSTLDVRGEHAIGCCGGRTKRHNGAMGPMKYALTKSATVFWTEQSLRQTAEKAMVRDGATIDRAVARYEQDAKDPNPEAARPCDLLLENWPCAGSASGLAGMDATVVKPTSQEAMRASRNSACAHMAIAHKRKMDEASGALGILGVATHPLVMSTNGRFHQGTHVFIDELARRSAHVLGVPQAESKRRLVQSISASIQRQNGEMLCAYGALLRTTAAQAAVARGPVRRVRRAAAGVPDGAAPVAVVALDPVARGGGRRAGRGARGGGRFGGAPRLGAAGGQPQAAEPVVEVQAEAQGGGVADC